MVVRPLLAVCFMVQVVACASEENATCTQADPSQWTRKEPASYVFEGCGTGLAPRACFITAVKDGRVVATYDSDEADGFEPLGPASAQTLTEVFSLGECGECERELKQNPQWGYLERVYLDCGEEGYGADVKCFAPDTLDPSACRAE